MKPRVIVFDDNDIFRSTLEHALEMRGYEVFAFPDPGVYRVCNFVSHDYRLDHAGADIIISDVNMPTER